MDGDGCTERHAVVHNYDSYPLSPKAFQTFQSGSASAPKGFRAMCYPLLEEGAKQMGRFFHHFFFWLHLSAHFARPSQTESDLPVRFLWFFSGFRFLVLEGACGLASFVAWFHFGGCCLLPVCPRCIGEPEGLVAICFAFAKCC